MNQQTQQRTSEQHAGDHDGVQGYLLSGVAIAGTGALPGGQLPSTGNPLLVANHFTEGLVLLDGPSFPPLPNPFQGPRINW
jgi:hypothetical protein